MQVSLDKNSISFTGVFELKDLSSESLNQDLSGMR